MRFQMRLDEDTDTSHVVVVTSHTRTNQLNSLRVKKEMLHNVQRQTIVLPRCVDYFCYVCISVRARTRAFACAYSLIEDLYIT